MDIILKVQMRKVCLLAWHNGIVLMKRSLIFRLKYGDILVKNGRANLKKFHHTALLI